MGRKWPKTLFTCMKWLNNINKNFKIVKIRKNIMYATNALTTPSLPTIPVQPCQLHPWLLTLVYSWTEYPTQSYCVMQCGNLVEPLTHWTESEEPSGYMSYWSWKKKSSVEPLWLKSGLCKSRSWHLPTSTAPAPCQSPGALESWWCGSELGEQWACSKATKQEEASLTLQRGGWEPSFHS